MTTEQNNDGSREFEFDKAGTLAAFLNMATDILETGQELFQNAADSCIPTTGEIYIQNISRTQAFEIPNRITFRFNPSNDILLTLQDNGRGITKDYDGDIESFLNAMKASSKKEGNPFTCGHKGLGMILYF